MPYDFYFLKIRQLLFFDKIFICRREHIQDCFMTGLILADFVLFQLFLTQYTAGSFLTEPRKDVSSRTVPVAVACVERMREEAAVQVPD